MKILFALTYYRPHVSGLTIYVERLSRELARRGHQVTVLTSHYERSLPYRERMGGVQVVRVPVLARISKGCLMPTFPFAAFRLVRECQVLGVHLPQFEGVVLAWLGWLLRRPVVLIYHCDIRFPPGGLRPLWEGLVGLVHHWAGRRADRIVTYTQDYAQHSSFLSRFRDKVVAILPPVALEAADPERCAQLKRELGLEGKAVVGVAARFAAEKGVEHLLAAIPHLERDLGDFRILFAGEYRKVIGENLFSRLGPLIEAHRQHLLFLGVVPPERMAEFTASATAWSSPASPPPNPSAWCRWRPCSPELQWWPPTSPASASRCASPGWGRWCPRRMPTPWPRPSSRW